MAKLWQKDYSLNKEIEKFTVGNDFLLDKNLVKYDVYGSIAHAMMLNKIGILNKNELSKLKKELINILDLDAKNKFEIKLEDEDAHTSIENHLTKKLGGLGKKIHTARSRNDQVLVDLRLYSKEKMLEVQRSAVELVSALLDAAEKYKSIMMPGYTHSRKAMPSSVGIYFGSFAESLIDDLELLDEAYELNDQCPLGSGAGYGIPIDIDRQFVSDILGFEKVQNNVLYVQNSRGKFESIIIFALSNIMNDLSRLSNDLTLFSMDEFGYFTLPDEFCTGSSIMPQKKNPDVFELTRAKAAKVDANLYLVKSIITKLQSGYNRDLQLTKEPLMESFEITLSALKLFATIINKIEVNEKKCAEACTQEIFATHHAYGLVKKGMPFRDAYKQAANNLKNFKKDALIPIVKLNMNVGGAGNLGIEFLRKNAHKLKFEIKSKTSNFEKIIRELTT